ncbi:hypothetical protein FOG51_02193 [Hanseniaspora uvarum]|uniref:Acyl-CoA-binding protein n=1 Tax=Hanseniaspora uvarum TaxID=29833 RepID=A0A1E5RDD1_HANUV|nr:hypothetical protein FOG48_03600 [Hanseniaspora uvarum]KAF0272901.1 hypothetical protein FOG51_02193 [Hanseniaspora uvarum]KAF0275896.1 hypothetical protein FOG50_03270 [Hanseniaspora uvarum]OEJ84908.1 Acyl-CoA-binding protein [Hanseniaspora uvarum]GMM41311.1 long-chain fatty acid transporter [Hanseniaspora uvarum]
MNFDEAVLKVKEIPNGKVTQDELLQLYALFKQHTVGEIPADSSRPGVFALKDRYKWDAWKKLAGMSKEQAAEEYVILVEQLLAKYL